MSIDFFKDKRPAHKKFIAKVEKPIDNGKGYWNYLDIGIFYVAKDGTETRLGGYQRNYSSFYDTFYPFRIKDQYYALYSKDYTATRVMTLPDCKDYCGEERDACGFCPTGYYVPNLPADGRHYKEMNIPYGFISGCVWGDDSSWKIQLIDLTKIEDKILNIKETFGYCWLNKGDKLKDAVKSVYMTYDGGWGAIIKSVREYDLDKEVNDD